MVQRPTAPAGTDRAADLAAIEKLHRQDIAVTVSRDPVGLTDLWTDDAIRLGGGQAKVSKQPIIKTSNERQTANKDFKVLSYVPETKDFTFLDGGWAVEWRTYTASYVDSPGGKPKQVRGTVLLVLKKLRRQLEMLPRYGRHVPMNCHTGEGKWHVAENCDEAAEA